MSWKRIVCYQSTNWDICTDHYQKLIPIKAQNNAFTQ